MGSTYHAPPFPSLTKTAYRQGCQTERKSLLPGFRSACIYSDLPSSNTHALPDAEEASLFCYRSAPIVRQALWYKSSRLCHARVRTCGRSAAPVHAVPPPISRGRRESRGAPDRSSSVRRGSGGAGLRVRFLRFLRLKAAAARHGAAYSQ